MINDFWLAVCLHLQLEQAPLVSAVVAGGTYGKPIVLHAKIYADTQGTIIPDVHAFHGPDMIPQKPMLSFLQCRPSAAR